jgi:hypothetical protein
MIGRHVEQCDADGTVQLVDVADGVGADMVLADAGAVDEAGFAGIAGAGVDLVEPDQRLSPGRP